MDLHEERCPKGSYYKLRYMADTTAKEDA